MARSPLQRRDQSGTCWHGDYRDGVAALERGDFVAAVEKLSRVSGNAGPAAVLARYYLTQARMGLGRQRLALGRIDEAAEQFRLAWRLDAACPGLADYLVRCYAAQGRAEQALDALERARDGQPDDVRLTIQQALMQWRVGRREQSLETLTEALRRRPEQIDFRYQLALLRAARDEYDAAIELLEEVARREPDHAEAQRHLGLAYGAAGRMEEAVRALAAARRLRPWDASVAWQFALALRALPEGRAAHSTALTERGGSGEGAVVRGTDERGGLVCAPSARLSEMLVREPEMVEAFLDLPTTERDAEVFGVLDGALHGASQRFPRYADLHHYRARVLGRLGRLEEAEAAEQRALAVNPDYVEALIHSARLLARMNRRDEAIARLERSVELGGDYADVHFELGELYVQAGRREEARSEYARALQLNSGYGVARAALEALAAA